MRKYSKLVLVMTVLMMVTCSILVACAPADVKDPPLIEDGDDKNPDVLTDEEIYDKIVLEHISKSGYTLNIESILKDSESEDYANADMYVKVDVTVAEGIATTVTKEKAFAEIGQDPNEKVTTTLNENYQGDKLSLQLMLMNFEKYVIVKEGSVMTLQGNILDANAKAVFGRDGYSNINISVNLDMQKNLVTSFIATFDQTILKSRMIFTLK